jgi:hypothetical protein
MFDQDFGRIDNLILDNQFIKNQLKIVVIAETGRESDGRWFGAWTHLKVNYNLTIPLHNPKI